MKLSDMGIRLDVPTGPIISLQTENQSIHWVAIKVHFAPHNIVAYMHSAVNHNHKLKPKRHARISAYQNLCP